jgi:hypothetical protein
MDYFPRKSLSKYLITDTIDFNEHVRSRWRAIRAKKSPCKRLTLLSRWSKAKFKSPCNFEESPYVAARIFSPLVIYENVDIVHMFIEIYRIRY